LALPCDQSSSKTPLGSLKVTWLTEFLVLGSLNLNATIALALTHDPLTKIHGQPNCNSAACLQLELCANAMAIHSSHGRGICGHLGMIMPAAEHGVMANAQPWVDPPNPGPLNIAAGATACQIALDKDAHDCNMS
jgi:hypothetical protein